MGKSKDEIMEKIKKLLALSKSDNEYEAFSALQMARKLMSKHNIDISDDIEIEAGDDDEVVNEVVFETAKKGILLIATVVADNFKCKAYYQKGSPMKINFVGKPLDVKIAKETLTYALIVSKKLAKKTIADLKAKGLSTKGAQHDYLCGFSKGLKECFEEQNRNEDESFALSMCTPVVVLDYMKGLKLTKGTTVKSRASESYTQGYMDGRTFNKKKIG